MVYKIYFYSLKFFILISVLIFLFSIFLGYFSAKASPNEAQIVLDRLEETYKPVIEADSAHQFLFVFSNNTLSLFFVVSFGVVFGISSILSLFSNGAILGILAFFSNGAIPWKDFFLGIMPHGVIEIPVMLIGCAIGLKIGKAVFDKVFKKKEISIKSEMFSGLGFFFKFLLPFLAVAAAIEVFLTFKIFGF